MTRKARGPPTDPSTKQTGATTGGSNSYGYREYPE